MVGFVTWPPFSYLRKCHKGETNHTCDKLLYVIQGVGKVISWPRLISTFWLHMAVCNIASDWPCTFLHPGFFSTYCPKMLKILILTSYMAYVSEFCLSK